MGKWIVSCGKPLDDPRIAEVEVEAGTLDVESGHLIFRSGRYNKHFCVPVGEPVPPPDEYIVVMAYAPGQWTRVWAV